MIKTPPYRNRKHETIEKTVLACQNKLQLRDWAIDIIFGDIIPKEFVKSDDGSCGYIDYDDGHLKGVIWISPIRCKDSNCDPVFVAKHEVAHAFLNAHNDEVLANIVASLL